MVRMLPLLRTLGLGVALLGAASGCSSGIREAIVTTRNHQGGGQAERAKQWKHPGHRDLPSERG